MNPKFDIEDFLERVRESFMPVEYSPVMYRALRGEYGREIRESAMTLNGRELKKLLASLYAESQEEGKGNV